MFTGVGFGFFRVYMTPSDALGVRFTFSGLRFSKRRRFIIDNRVFIGFTRSIGFTNGITSGLRF
jgi:hypothetical protein